MRKTTHTGAFPEFSTILFYLNDLKRLFITYLLPRSLPLSPSLSSCHPLSVQCCRIHPTPVSSPLSSEKRNFLPLLQNVQHLQMKKMKLYAFSWHVCRFTSVRKCEWAEHLPRKQRLSPDRTTALVRIRIPPPLRSSLLRLLPSLSPPSSLLHPFLSLSCAARVSPSAAALHLMSGFSFSWVQPLQQNLTQPESFNEKSHNYAEPAYLRTCLASAISGPV